MLFRSEKIKFVNATEYGWETNVATKNTMLQALSRAIENGHIELNDPDLIAEARGYTTGDIMDKDIDPRLTTRHFDLLMACAIALSLNSFVKLSQVERNFGSIDPFFMGIPKKQEENPAL